jgi:hypothetical protein
MLTTRTAPAEIAHARAMLATDRAGALAALQAVFRAGHAPSTPLDGRYRGALITPSLNPLLDRFGRWLTARWLPWQGKTFDARAHTGDNLFTNDGLPLARLVFPFYRRYVSDGPGRSRALEFRTYLGPGALDPGLTVLKIDYDWDRNPSFVVRDVLDELVQVDEECYLGQALLRWGAERTAPRWVCAAYFTLEAT